MTDDSEGQTVTVNGCECNSSFFDSCKKATNTEILRDKARKARAACLHLPDGTAVIFFRNGGHISAYEFNFEESVSWDVLSSSNKKLPASTF